MICREIQGHSCEAYYKCSDQVALEFEHLLENEADGVPTLIPPIICCSSPQGLEDALRMALIFTL